jgi:NADH-quinone oxidoreductase subunit M
MIGLSMSVKDPFFSQEMGRTVHTFDFRQLTDFKNYIPHSILHPYEKQMIFGVPARLFAFILLIVGFGIKLPSVPFHTWLPDAHVEAPTPVSVVLAGILLKLGVFGFLRFSLTLFPHASFYFSPLIYILSICGIIYASFSAIRQTDFKRIIAYSSVSHMNLVTLGIFSFNVIGLEGSIMQSISHGFVSSAMFFMIGILYDRYHSRLLYYYGGLVHMMPVYSGLFLAFLCCILP